ncbi:hypothetical protein LY76DRAFT_267821 [Colletotrichum caudatum]|nr:hypothetical protein LY76DRAFT_267821 [Colletotrichum caudatum]
MTGSGRTLNRMRRRRRRRRLRRGKGDEKNSITSPGTGGCMLDKRDSERTVRAQRLGSRLSDGVDVMSERGRGLARSEWSSSSSWRARWCGQRRNGCYDDDVRQGRFGSGAGIVESVSSEARGSDAEWRRRSRSSKSDDDYGDKRRATTTIITGAKVGGWCRNE